ncbi:MAG: fasciclin domain-containing protein [Prevotellaceae bacterium]|jgi:uncharacterized surface protein with fasciclin (FAS1) repeats|nr:fasciclin domain-containing protein [Prevotellaceae bacterium]
MKLLSRIFLFSFVLLALRCQKERDQYYKEPEWAGKSIYETLQDEGRFEMFLRCVDKTLYATSLKGNGLWTVFAPNDDAFAVYLTANGYSSVEDIPKDKAEQLVAYSMLYNKYELDRLPDVLGGAQGAVWDTLKSTKKRTPYYETIHREMYNGDSVWVANATSYNGISTTDNNYKYLPFYLSRNFGSKLPSDYETFYPQRPYTGKNVQAAAVVSQDMMASNGVAHEVDFVNDPLPNLEDLLGGEDYSQFKELLEFKNATGEPFFYSYLTTAWFTSYYKTMYPSRDISVVYGKFYEVPFEFLRPPANAIAIPLNCERYFLAGAEEGGYTLYAPNNEAIGKFFEDVVRPYGYASVRDLPSNVLGYFINAHMALSVIWPSEHKGAKNVYENYINGEGSTGAGFDPSVYVDVKPASNGLFYGSKAYVKNHYFETVLTEILLRPARYSFMYNALQKHFLTTLMEDFVKCPLNGYTEESYTVLLPSDDQLKADGFDWVWPAGASAYEFTHSREGVNAGLRIQRLVRSHVFKRIKTGAIDTRISDFAGNPSGGYGGYAYAMNDYGDMIRYRNNTVEMIGNHTAGEVVNVTKVKEFSNGSVFTVDKLLQYAEVADDYEEKTLLERINRAAADNPNVSIAAGYLDYLLSTGKYSLSEEAFFTLLLPTNAQMQELQKTKEVTYYEDGNPKPESAWRYVYLPLHTILSEEAKGDGASGDLLWSKSVDDIKSFFQYHIIPGALYINDGYDHVVFSTGRVQRDAIAATALKDGLNSTFVRILKDGGDGNNLRFSSQGYSAEEKTISVVKGVNRSNVFAPKAVIHEVDGYLMYKN